MCRPGSHLLLMLTAAAGATAGSLSAAVASPAAVAAVPACEFDAAELSREARARRDAGDLEAALRLNDALLACYPDDVDLAIERARILAWLGRLEDSRAALVRITASNPERADAWGVLGDTELWAGDLGGAWNTVRRGLLYAPRSVELLVRLARLEYFHGDVGAAREHTRTVLVIDPDLLEARRALAVYAPWSFDLDLQYESVSDRDPWRTGSFRASWRPVNPWSFDFTGRWVHRFGQGDAAAEVAVQRSLGRRVRARGALELSPGAAHLPRTSTALETRTFLAHRWRLEQRLRALRYDTGTTTIVDLGMVRGVGGRFEAGYQWTWARDLEQETDTTHTARLLWAPSWHRAAQLSIFHGRDVARLTNNRDTRTTSTTGFVVSVRQDVVPRWGLRVSGGYVVRHGDYRRLSLGLGVLHRR